MTKTISTVSDRATVRKILAIRSAARISLGMEPGHGPNDKCPTCCRPARDGFMRYVDGKAYEGCVDACHVPYELGSTNRGHWLSRQGAREIRRAELAQLESL